MGVHEDVTVHHGRQNCSSMTEFLLLTSGWLCHAQKNSEKSAFSKVCFYACTHRHTDTQTHRHTETHTHTHTEERELEFLYPNPVSTMHPLDTSAFHPSGLKYHILK